MVTTGTAVEASRLDRQSSAPGDDTERSRS
jgi:hypothetical protein